MMTTWLHSRSLVTTALVIAAVGCSGTRFGKCQTCDQGMVYPPAGTYDSVQPIPADPPSLHAPAPIPVPPATDPNVPPAPPPPVGARVPAALQGIRYSTTDFFHNANNNVRAMFHR